MSLYVRMAIISISTTLATMLVFALVMLLMIGSLKDNVVWQAYLMVGPISTLTMGPFLLWLFPKLGVRQENYIAIMLAVGCSAMVVFSFAMALFDFPLLQQTMAIFGYGSDQALLFVIHEIIFGLPPIITYALALVFVNDLLEKKFPSPPND